MAKRLFFAVLLLADTVALSLAQSDQQGTQSCRDVQCQREVQQVPLHACWQLLDRHLSGLHVVVPYWMRPWEPRAQCCQQLQDVSPECRCAAIRRIVSSYAQSFGGERRQQQGEGYYGGGTGRQQAGAGGRCGCSQTEEWQPMENRGYIGFPPRTGTEQQQTTSERLTKLWQYARQLPAMCRIEPQECSISRPAAGQN